MLHMLGKKTKQNRFLSKVLMWILCVCVLMIKSILKLKSYSQVVKTKNAKSIYIYCIIYILYIMQKSIYMYIYIWKRDYFKKKTQANYISNSQCLSWDSPHIHISWSSGWEGKMNSEKDHSWLSQKEEIPQLPWELYLAKAVCPKAHFWIPGQSPLQSAASICLRTRNPFRVGLL